MKTIISSSMVKIFMKDDCFPIKGGVCFQNESLTFQIYIQAEEDFCGDVRAEGLSAKVYRVCKLKGDSTLRPLRDDYFVAQQDEIYPDLLQPIDKLCLAAGESATLFVGIPATEKQIGVHTVSVYIGVERIFFPVEVLGKKLPETDLILTNWFHLDGICHRYGVTPFTQAFYDRFRQFLEAYVKLGNTMLLIPLFTPPLDTEVGGERLTTQLVGVNKEGDCYSFDFTELKNYIDIASEYGIKYFEFSHLFTQWGGEFCPKIEVTESGERKNIFGWSVSSTDEGYLQFLAQFLTAFIPKLEEWGIKERSFMHLTDEPHDKHVAAYEKLFTFIKERNGGISTMDALSSYEFAAKGIVDMPAVSIESPDLPLFQEREHLLYYCVGVDDNYITNRYFHMPTLRTTVLGMQIYMEGAKGFLHWGYNFYNSEHSRSPINPYEDTTASGVYPAGDSFLVYPGKEGVEYSLRYFAILQAFEEYRLLKGAEACIGREGVLAILKKYGFEGVHKYPHNVAEYLACKEEIRAVVL